jgi:N-acetylglutamate synthase-like GNAT family acetyltransferase
MHPLCTGRGYAALIIDAIKKEVISRGMTKLSLTSTPNAALFYQKQGFIISGEHTYPSSYSDAQVHCIDMFIELSR